MPPVQIFLLSLFIPLCLSSVIIDQRNCPVPRVRNSWTTLTTDQQQLYLTANQLLKSQKSSPAFTVPRISSYNIFPIIHNYTTNVDCSHGSSIFLPWHRRFLWVFETALRQAITNYNNDILYGKTKGEYLDACVTVPYWAWENDYANSSQASIYGNNSFGVPPETGCVNNGKFAGWMASDGSCLTRQFLSKYGGISKGAGGMMDLVINNLEYWEFEASLEGSPHASIHNYIGGNMLTMASTDDPLFWLHHSNVDRFWTMWQDCHDYEIVSPMSTTDTIYPASGYGFETNVCNYGIDDTLPYSWITGQSSTYFFEPATSRMMLSLGSSTEQYGPDKMYFRYGPDYLVQSMENPLTWTNGQPGCNFGNDWINYQGTSEKRSEQLAPINDNSTQNINNTYLFGTAENEKMFKTINSQWGHHPTKYRITYLALWECSVQFLGNRTLSVPEEWVIMNNFDNNNTFISLCEKEGYFDGYEAYALLIEEQLFSKGQAYGTGLAVWEFALILTAVIVVVLGILAGVILLCIRKKSKVDPSMSRGLSEFLLS